MWREESGATALEYGLICALVVVGMIVALTLVSTRTVSMYNFIITTWDNAVH
jgi:pilus assembly protein Flp/PilA